MIAVTSSRIGPVASDHFELFHLPVFDHPPKVGQLKVIRLIKIAKKNATQMTCERDLAAAITASLLKQVQEIHDHIY